MCPCPTQQTGATCHTASSGLYPRSTRQRKCRPGYKSRAKQARSRQKAKNFNLVLTLRQEKFDLTAQIGDLKSYIHLVNKSHQEELTSSEISYTKHHNLTRIKYNQLSEMYTNLQEHFRQSEKRNAHLQEQLDATLDKNRTLVKKVSTLEQFRPAHTILNSPLDLRLRALEEQLLPVNTIQKSPLDLRLQEVEAKPPEVVYDLVSI